MADWFQSRTDQSMRGFGTSTLSRALVPARFVTQAGYNVPPGTYMGGTPLPGLGLSQR